MDPIEQLHDFISAIGVLKDKEWEAFSNIWQPFESKRKTVLTTAGETEKHLYFVIDWRYSHPDIYFKVYQVESGRHFPFSNCT